MTAEPFLPVPPDPGGDHDATPLPAVPGAGKRTRFVCIYVFPDGNENASGEYMRPKDAIDYANLIRERYGSHRCFAGVIDLDEPERWISDDDLCPKCGFVWIDTPRCPSCNTHEADL